MTIEPTEKLIAALDCAVRVLDGAAGGESHEAKEAARDTLLDLNTKLVREWRDAKANTAT
jgi:hypothetical protein